MGNLCTPCQLHTGQKKPRIEHILLELLSNMQPHLVQHAICNQTEVCGGTIHRKDVQWILPDQRRIVVEIDESSHADRDMHCEVARYDKFFTSAEQPAMTIIRFSTQMVDTHSSTIPHALDGMISLILDLMQEKSGDWSPPGTCWIHYFRYSDIGAHHIRAAQQASAAGSVIHAVTVHEETVHEETQPHVCTQIHTIAQLESRRNQFILSLSRRLKK